MMRQFNAERRLKRVAFVVIACGRFRRAGQRAGQRRWPLTLGEAKPLPEGAVSGWSDDDVRTEGGSPDFARADLTRAPLDERGSRSSVRALRPSAWCSCACPCVRAPSRACRCAVPLRVPSRCPCACRCAVPLRVDGRESDSTPPTPCSSAHSLAGSRGRGIRVPSSSGRVASALLGRIGTRRTGAASTPSRQSIFPAVDRSCPPWRAARGVRATARAAWRRGSGTRTANRC